MVSLLSNKNFFVNKNRLEIDNKNSLSLIALISSSCPSCLKLVDVLYKSNNFPKTLHIGLANINNNANTINILKNLNIIIDRVPIFLIFKLGIFDKIVMLNEDEEICEKNILAYIDKEIDQSHVITKNYIDNSYQQF